MRGVLLMAHIATALTLLAATAVMALTAAGLRRGRTVRALRWRARVLRTAVWLVPTAVIVLGGTGWAMLGSFWNVSDVWLAVALVQALILAVVAVGVAWDRLNRLVVTLGAADGGGPAPGSALALARDPGLTMVLGLTPLAVAEICYLMVNKPSAVASLEVLGLVLVAGLAIRLTASRRSEPRRGIARVAVSGLVVLVLVVAAAGYAAWRLSVSRLPAAVSMSMPNGSMAGMTGPMTSVANLTSAPAGTYVSGRTDVFTLTAEVQTAEVAGHATQVWGYGGLPADRVLHVRQGDRVIVHLVNRLSVSTTIHWHGLDVPAADDGVAGVTQNAVAPGGTYTYDFVVGDAGTYWFHSHQDAVNQIAKGLFGAIVVAPRTPDVPAVGVDDTVLVHTWTTPTGQVTTLGAGPLAATPGERVRLRVVNTDSVPRRVTVAGAAFTVVAMDGRALNAPTPLRDTRLTVPAGGRYDVEFTVPSNGSATLWSLDGAGTPSLVVGAGAAVPAPTSLTEFDFTRYGGATSATSGITTASHFTRQYTVTLDGHLGWYDGSFGYHYTIDGKAFPNGPTLTVSEGDLVEITIVNRTAIDHPMHLHGAHFTVLEKNGVALSGSPVQLDTLDVGEYSTWTVAFRADNPGLWMFHCHNLTHASTGMDLMIAYTGVSTPYAIGTASGNLPE
jgi:FtsP/CotA-like multicopper oxidase with cupredoxin domain